MATVCLAMIVKNEAAVIDRCLAAARPFLDSWVICDTGSTDDTRERAVAAMDGLPGELHERPWVHFGHNRSESLAYARTRADYTLVLDADHMIEGDPAVRMDLTADAYDLQLTSVRGGPEWWLPLLLRNDRSWHYVGAVHEFVAIDPPCVKRRLSGLRIVDHQDGGSGRDLRWDRDLQVLEAELRAAPDNPRAVYYVARTLSAMGRLERAAMMYEHRATMGGWDEEVYSSLHALGLLRARLGDWPRAAEAFQRATEARPIRVEALHDYVVGLRERRRHHTAAALTRGAIGTPVPEDQLFVEPWKYHWGLTFELSITSYWIGDNRVALAACDELLARDDLPDTYRQATERNRRFCLARL